MRPVRLRAETKKKKKEKKKKKDELNLLFKILCHTSGRMIYTIAYDYKQNRLKLPQLKTKKKDVNEVC